MNARSDCVTLQRQVRPSPGVESLSEHPTKVRGAYSPFDRFQWLSPEAHTAFNQASRRRHFADSRRIYSQSEPGNEMYRIVSGYVRMSVLRNDGREALHSVLGAGDC